MRYSAPTAPSTIIEFADLTNPIVFFFPIFNTQFLHPTSPEIDHHRVKLKHFLVSSSLHPFGLPCASKFVRGCKWENSTCSGVVIFFVFRPACNFGPAWAHWTWTVLVSLSTVSTSPPPPFPFFNPLFDTDPKDCSSAHLEKKEIKILYRVKMNLPKDLNSHRNICLCRFCYLQWNYLLSWKWTSWSKLL